METTLEKKTATKSSTEKIRLYVVWIDTNCGDFGETDWEINTCPKPLTAALVESSEVSQAGLPTTVTLEGITPRPDGLFSNPLTDP